MQIILAKKSGDPSSNVGARFIAPLQAWVDNGTLYITGRKQGATLRIYNLLGQLIYADPSTIAPPQAAIPLPKRGIYIVASGNEVLKVID